MYGNLAMREGSALLSVSELPPPSASLRTHANGEPFAVSLAGQGTKKKEELNCFPKRGSI